MLAPDGSGRRDLVLGTAVGPIYWSPNDRYVSFDGRLDAKVVPVDAPCCDAARSLGPAVSGPWAPRQMHVVIGLESGHLVTAKSARLGSLSPDAGRVAYSTTRAASPRSRSTAATDGGSLRTASIRSGLPTGQWIAFESSRGIELIRPEGKDRHPLLAP